MANNYLQSSYTGSIYKVMDTYLLKLSPWKDGEDRRLYEYDNNDMHVVTYQNACMIVNKQYNEIDEEWEHRGKRYKARAVANKNIDEHTAMLSMLPSHYIKESTKILKTLPDENSITIEDAKGNAFKMVKHNGKKVTNKPSETNAKFKSVVASDSPTMQIKPYEDTGYRYPCDILNVRREKLGSTVHPTQKPVELLEWLIKTFSNENDLVLDNCMGSGSTGVACKNLNRNFIGIELDENYFNIAKERIDKA